MSERDSFIEEVSEEVRRDQLMRFLRRRGWIIGAVVFLIVGAATANEVLKARAVASAEAAGDRLLEALAIDDAAARADALADAARQQNDPLLLGLHRAAAELDAGDADAAASSLRAIAEGADTPPLYRDLTRLLLVMVQGADLPMSERLATLQSLAAPGAPFRPLALEQRAISNIEAGETDAALADLAEAYSDARSTAALRERAANLIQALGGEVPEPEPVLLDG